jgi:uncharacterized protein YbbK (DUF523 family)
MEAALRATSYDGTFTGRKIKGQGVFAKKLMEHGIKVVDVEDL